VATIDELKEQEVAPTPLFLFECALRNGSIERFATHGVRFEGQDYLARVVRHNVFQLTEAWEEKISVTLANADSRYSQIERETGFKGSLVTVRFLFFDLVAGAPASEARVLFRGLGNAADDITEAELRVGFTNRLNLQRIVLPEVRIGRRCPWLFPSTPAQRAEAVDGGTLGKYSALFKCGYSADQPGGVGSLDGAVPFTSCDYTRASCSARGMFDTDASARVTRRFGGVEFVPPQIVVRSFGEKGSHLSPVAENEARYNDVVPIVYGTAWFQPPVVLARNDGNLTRMEVLLGIGEIESVLKVVVNDVEIPEGVAGADMTATGWFNVVSHGSRTGAFNADFTDSSGKALGDPYGSMALLSVVVPNRVSNGQSLAKVQVLEQGVRLERFDAGGSPLGEAFTNNPAWVLLDVLRRSGWKTSEIDLGSFASAAEYCAEPVETTDLYGNATAVPRFQCNLAVRNRQSAAEIARGIRLGSSLMLTYGISGLVTLRVENTLALQQASKPAGSNSTEMLSGGWPAYEFSDGSAEFSGLLTRASGEPSIRVYTRSGGDAPNRLSVEFQDEFNEYQQDSLSLVDVDDAVLTGREVSAGFGGLGLPNFDQAARMLDLALAKSIRGNTLVDFETTVRGIGLTPGDIAAITYLKEGWDRQAFRVIRVAPGKNYQTVAITAQWHDDAWYTTGGSAAGGRRRRAAEIGLPRPLAGTETDEHGLNQFGITEDVTPTGEGGHVVKLGAAFVPPVQPVPAGAAIPLVSLNPGIATTGGLLTGGQTYYYAVSAADAGGTESGLSFAVRATIPPGTNTNAVTLSGLSFSPSTAAFNVYRGASPAQLLRIAHGAAVAATFADTGAAPENVPPPDENYNHANFYWRMELQPEMSAGIHSATTIGNSTLGMLTDELKGAVVAVMRGQGARQERAVAGNDATTITVSPAWTVEPDATSFFTVAEGTWKFGGLGMGSPVEFEVPNRPGATVQVSGRSANVHDQESAYELNPVTRWQIGGGPGGIDTDTPPKPVFGLNPGGQGTVELVSVGFTTLANTHTISAGTLGLFYWDELASPAGHTTAADIDDSQTTITITPAGSAEIGTLLQIEGEILEVTGVHSGTEYAVLRGAYESPAAAHGAGTLVYHLTRGIFVVPFVKGFLGSPASGSFSYSIFLPDVRIGAAELFVTNAVGNGPTGKGSFGGLTDRGLRTLSGGQISIQVEGYLAIQENAAPGLVIEEAHAPRDIFAVVREAPEGGDITLRVRLGDVEYCTLTIVDGDTVSNRVNGFGLPKLTADSVLTLDVTGVPGDPDTLPGRDLTVTIRL
jgi:hypothetical protein